MKWNQHACIVFELVYKPAGFLFFCPLSAFSSRTLPTNPSTSSLFLFWPSIDRPCFGLLPVVVIFLHLLSILSLPQGFIPKDVCGRIAFNLSLPIHLASHHLPTHYLPTYYLSTYPSTAYPLTTFAIFARASHSATQNESKQREGSLRRRSPI
jgi:hypothetical protein